MKRRLFFFSLFLGLIGIGASAFEENGINYGITSSVDLTCKVIGGSYSGTVTIPSTVIYDGATYSVTGIGAYAFERCFDLTSVIIPTSVTTIEERAFVLSGLTSITIPYSVKSIGQRAFDDCDKLTSIVVDGNNIYYSSENGILYDKRKETLIRCPQKKKGSLIIPNTVCTIATTACSRCTYLTNLIIPNSVTSIENYAFSGCSSIPSVIIPNTVTSIGICAFYLCSGLTSITIPNSVTTIEESVFSSCTSLTKVTIPNSVNSIGNGAFAYCSGLKKITIGNSVLSVGEYAFRDCPNITSVIIPNSVTSIGHGAFSGCSSLNSVSIGNSVKVIETNVFRGCTSLTEVTIPNSVTIIVSYAFQGCSRLNSIIIGNSVKEIPYGVFLNCSNLRNIIIGDSVEEIAENAFEHSNLYNVVFLGTNPPWIYSTSFKNPENITFHVPAGCKAAYFASQDLWKKYTIVEDNAIASNYEYVDANNNSFARPLSYDDTENNSVVVEDGYRFIEVKEDIPLKQISYERNFGNTNWQSLYVPFEIPVTAALLEDFEFAYINGAKQYDDDDDGTPDRMTIESFKVKSGTLRANHPYLIRAKVKGEKTITVNEATLYATVENSVDCSTTSRLFTFQSSYSLLNYEDMVNCYLLGGGTWNMTASGNTMKPMRFYLKVTSRGNSQVIASAPTIRLQVDGEMTGIGASPISSPEGKDIILDLQGRRVEHPENGIYIINGKKTIVR